MNSSKLQKNQIANTFLFTSKLLDQRRRISDAQIEVIHGLLHDVAAAANNGASQDPAAMAQHVMQTISQSMAGQSKRSGALAKETAEAYAEILRLVMAYGGDTFAGWQTISRDAAKLNAPSGNAMNPWMDSFMRSFEDAANLLSRGFSPIIAMVRSEPARRRGPRQTLCDRQGRQVGLSQGSIGHIASSREYGR